MNRNLPANTEDDSSTAESESDTELVRKEINGPETLQKEINVRNIDITKSDDILIGKRVNYYGSVSIKHMANNRNSSQHVDEDTNDTNDVMNASHDVPSDIGKIVKKCQLIVY